MKVALCVNENYNDEELNASGVGEKIIEAAFYDADVIVFPSHVLTSKITGVLKDDIKQFEETEKYIKEIKELAKDHVINVCFGYDYFNGEKIKTEYKVFNYLGKEEKDYFVIDKYKNKKYEFSINNFDKEYAIILNEKEFVENKKIFKVNKLYKDIDSGKAIYYYNEIIKETEINKSDMIYIDFE